MSHEVPQYDAIVVGAGVAGLRAASALRGHRIAVLRPDFGSREGASHRSTGGIAAAVGDDDSPRLHARDTVEAGDGLCDREAVEMLADAAPRQIRTLDEMGVAFDRTPAGSLALGREAAHSRRRIVHTHGDEGGRVLVETLYGAAVDDADDVDIVSGEAVEICRPGDRVRGLLYRGPDRRLHGLAAPTVILATGGLGGLYKRTTNPNALTGRGLALAYRAGATLADLEFVQFHPTALDVERDRLPLLSELLRGDGARLVDDNGDPILGRRDGMRGELAPRHIVARAVWQRTTNDEPVYLDVSSVPDFTERFPGAADAARLAADDGEPHQIPVAPAAHYHMGGVRADLDGRTDVPGLWACGEVAHTGVHGANRLASNSMLECLVSGERAGRSVAKSESVDRSGHVSAVTDLLERRHHRRTVHSRAPKTVLDSVRHLMWNSVGLHREPTQLEEATRLLRQMRREVFVRARMRDAALVAELVALSARYRKESRGSHFRTDFPAARKNWRGRILIRCDRKAPDAPHANRLAAKASCIFAPVEQED